MISVKSSWLLPDKKIRALLIKWLVALLVPVGIFTFVWNGEGIVNNIFLALLTPQMASPLYTDAGSSIQAALFLLIFYATVIALAGYLVASDSGRRTTVGLWITVLFSVVSPLLLVVVTQNLLVGLALFALVWIAYIIVRRLILSRLRYVPPAPITSVEVFDERKQQILFDQARAGSFWFATIFAVVSLVLDIVYFAVGTLQTILLVWVVVRTILLPVVGYFLGTLGGKVALRQAITANDKNEQVVASETNGKKKGWNGSFRGIGRKQQLDSLSAGRANEEARDLIPNDLPLQSRGASRFYLLLLLGFVLFYPALDPLLFGAGTNGRLEGYTDLGYYIILALGLNIVVGFAGLLDLGYVAFFAIGTYTWAMVGSYQLTKLTGLLVNPTIWPWLFWPILIVAALIAALWGLLLGAPTLRLRGDYLAIVTLGFGEIIPAFFLNLPQYTNGINGIVGIFPPNTPCIKPLFCVTWSSFNSTPFYYLILALIVLTIFVNIRLRDSRLGRAWIAIREDEIAASSSGINLVNTKLFAFAAGAFFSGIAGVYHAAKLGTVAPTDFNYSDSIVYLAMVVIGGLGSIPGVIVGAVVVYSINLFILAQLDTMASDPTNILHVIVQVFPTFTFSSVRNLLFGLTLILIMIFRPEGLIPSARRRRELHNESNDEEVSAGSLDIPPGSAEFEAEMHVE